jgi:aminoglycoside/choline kinase family phosphotransferase
LSESGPEWFDSAMPLDPRIVRYLGRRAKDGLETRSVSRLTGDASERSYYRVKLQKGSLVLALMPAPFEPESEPFLNVARLFERIPIRIPVIHDVSGPDGIILLEDCGDDLLQVCADPSQDETTRSLYDEALSILVRLQRRGAELDSTSYLPYQIAFDQEKLFWELGFFKRHFLQGLRGAALSSAESELLAGEFSRISAELASRPRVLCHRDYHSRNLMVSNRRLVVLDFQDARLGPASYDLVSLLYDSYVELARDFVEEMKEQFRRSSEPSGQGQLDEEFDLMALQRNLKALGTFGYQISVRGKLIYRRYVPHTLELVRSNLERNPHWGTLRRALAAHLPELE